MKTEEKGAQPRGALSILFAPRGRRVFDQPLASRPSEAIRTPSQVNIWLVEGLSAPSRRLLSALAQPEP